MDYPLASLAAHCTVGKFKKGQKGANFVQLVLDRFPSKMYKNANKALRTPPKILVIFFTIFWRENRVFAKSKINFKIFLFINSIIFLNAYF